MNRVILFLLLAVFGLIGCQNLINDPIDSVVQIVTDSKSEILKGQRQYPLVLAQSGGNLVNFPITTTYLNELIKQLAETTDSPFPWEIQLVNDASINAWALPGGKMGVNYGLVEVVETESELVSVLGHEMAHSIELHGTGRETFSALVSITAQILEIGVSDSGINSRSNKLVGLGKNIIMGQYSQANELEADRLGIELMVRAGFDPKGAIGMQEKLAKLDTSGNTIAQKLLGTHPISRERLKLIRTEAAKYPGPTQAPKTGLDRAKKEINSSKKSLDLVTKAREFGAEKKFSKAIRFVNRALLTITSEPSLWRLKAELLVANRKPMQAIETAKKVIELDPLNPMNELLLEYCYDSAGQYANADAARNRARLLMF